MKVEEVLQMVFPNKLDGTSSYMDFPCAYGSSRSIMNNFETECDAWYVSEFIAVIVYRSIKIPYAYCLVRKPLFQYGDKSVYQVSLDDAIGFIKAHGGKVDSDPMQSIGELVCECRIKEFYTYSHDDKWYDYQRSDFVVYKRDGKFILFSKSGNGISRMSSDGMSEVHSKYVDSILDGVDVVAAEKKRLDKLAKKSELESERRFFVRSVDVPEEVLQWWNRIVLAKSL